MIVVNYFAQFKIIYDKNSYIGACPLLVAAFIFVILCLMLYERL